MSEERIVPRFKVLVSYDMNTPDVDSYYQFVMGEFVPAVQAMGVRSAAGQAQVSMNLLDYTTTPVHRAFEAVQAEAARHGVEVHESEVVGLIPLDAVADVARASLRLRGFDRGQILEAKLMEE